jgi:alkylation response protein AidB-like acyl-CoA dehydrogenase
MSIPLMSSVIELLFGESTISTFLQKIQNEYCMRNFTEEQNMFREAYRKFLEQDIAPNMEKWREQGIVDREAFTKAGEQGFLMIWPKEQYGGLGDSDFRFEQIIIEETVFCPVVFPAKKFLR